MTKLKASLKYLHPHWTWLGIFFLAIPLAQSNQIIIPKDLCGVSVVKSATVTQIETFCSDPELCSFDSIKKIVHLKFPLKSCKNSLGPVSTFWSPAEENASQMTLYVSAVEYETEAARHAQCSQEAFDVLLISAPSKNLKHVVLKVLQ